MDRQQTDYNKLIGRQGGDYIFLDYIFDHGDGFKGATGSRMCPVTFAEMEEQDERRIKVAARKLLDEKMGDFPDKVYELQEFIEKKATDLLGVRYNHKGSIIFDGEEE